MNTGFEFWDYFVFVSYAIVILAIGLWVSRNKDGKQKSASFVKSNTKMQKSN